MTTPGTMNSILERLRNKIEDAEADSRTADSKFNGEQNENYQAGYAGGYAEALKEFWFDMTGDKYAANSQPQT